MGLDVWEKHSMLFTKAGTVGRKTVGLVALVCAVLIAAPAAPGGDNLYRIADLKALEDAFTELADEVRPQVVAIRCFETKGDPASLVKLPISQGSGFVIDAAGFIATNNHVVEGADAISVTLHDGLRYEAALIKTDPRSDLAVLKIDDADLAPVSLFHDKELKVNQWAFACGNPFGLAFDNDGRASVTYGVVSALSRDMTRRLAGNSERQYYGNLIETSATINPGSSGGPLFDLDGEVIGIVTAIETTSGVSEGHGYAIPINQHTRRILDLLRRGEEVKYGFLGVRVRDVEPPLSQRVAESNTPRGARIERVTIAHGPADLAGLRAGDVVIEFDGHAVGDSDHLVQLVQYTPVGSTVDVTYLRRSVRRTAEVTLGNRSELLEVAIEGEEP